MSQDLWIIVPRWTEFQHYRDRDPKWIKVYNNLLSSDDYLDLSGHRRAVLHGLWLAYAASGCELRLNTRSLSRRLQLKVTSADLDALEGGSWIGYATTPEKVTNEWASRYVSDDARATVLERDDHKCVVCGSTERLEIDHKTPISRGGTGEIENLQTLCRSHNRQKKDGASVPDLSSVSLPRVREEKREEEKRGAVGVGVNGSPDSPQPRLKSVKDQVRESLG